jgi:hypothetical protein
MRTIDSYATEAKAQPIHDRRRSLALADPKPGVQWDYHKIVYFALTMLGGSVVWAFVFGAIRHGIK